MNCHSHHPASKEKAAAKRREPLLITTGEKCCRDNRSYLGPESPPVGHLIKKKRKLHQVDYLRKRSEFESSKIEFSTLLIVKPGDFQGGVTTLSPMSSWFSGKWPECLKKYHIGGWTIFHEKTFFFFFKDPGNCPKKGTVDLVP